MDKNMTNEEVHADVSKLMKEIIYIYIYIYICINFTYSEN